MQFNVWQQRPCMPAGDGKWNINLLPVGEVSAPNLSGAITAARKLPCFIGASRRSFGAFPLVAAT